MHTRFEYSKHDDWFNFALKIQTPYGDDADANYNAIHLMVFGHSLWIKIPLLIRPKTKWVDLTNQPWAHSREDGRKRVHRIYST